MDQIRIVYRDNDRTPLLYVIQAMAAEHESLDVRIDRMYDEDEYEQGFLQGNHDLICEHLRFLFPARLKGHPVRVLASCQNHAVERLLASQAVHGLDDLRGKRIAIRGMDSSRLSSIQWLKQLGLHGRVETVIVEDEDIGRWQQWRKVAAGEADAVICSPLYAEPALAAGLHDLDAPPLVECGSLFFAALGPFISGHEGELRKFMRAVYRALHVFHNQPERTLAIMSGEPARLMKVEDPATLRRHYDDLRKGYDERPIPSVQGIATTYALLNGNYAPLDGLNPLTLWDLRYVLELEESGFMDELKLAAAARQQ